MITVRKQPVVVQGVRNPIVFELGTNNYYSSAGRKAQNMIRTLGQFNSGSITFTFNSISITFTVVTTPDNTGTQIHKWTVGGGMSQLQYLNLLLVDLRRNYLLNKFFNISISNLIASPRIMLEAKEAGTVGNIIISSNTTRLQLYYNVAGANAVMRDFFSIRLQTIIGNSILNEDQVYADNGFFDISEVLKPELKSMMEFPEVSSQNLIKRADICKKYSVAYNESWENPQTIQGNSFVENKYAINGGIPRWKQNDFYKTYTSLYNYLLTTKSFLTFQPNNKTTDTSAVEKLYFTILGTYTNATAILKAKVIYTDATYTIVSKGSITVNTFDTLEVECGYNKLSLASINTNKTVKYYEVYLQIGSTVISEVRKYVMDYGYYDNKKYFVFKNSLGGYDSVRFTGISSRKFTLERTEYDNYSLSYYSALYQERKQLITNENTPETLNTGWLPSLEWFDYINEILISEDVYEYKGTQIDSIIITSNEVQKDADTVKLYSMNIEYYKLTRTATIQQLAGIGIGSMIIGNNFRIALTP